MTVVNWNVQWATPRSQRSPEILGRIAEHTPEIICLTETDAGLLAQNGHTICSEPDYGSGAMKNRRKVLLWSKQPWDKIDCLRNTSWTVGRFVSGVTDTSLGQMLVVGICIPWSHSRTRRYGGNSEAWQDHENYLNGLADLLARTPTHRTIVVGDFNQPIAQSGNVPARLRAKLRCAIPPRMTIATAGLGSRGKRTIDHIVLSADLTAESLGIISNIHEDKKLSDHFGVAATLTTQTAPISNHSEE
ncbi:MAG: endonuclease/exonuclease/phosphatase family protein [Chloroflexi bacterium]|nr:endonuclease/exonuclease/phosphatase family protein [Chloroflexota bacterium]